MKNKRFKVWVELEKDIKAKTKDEAEDIFRELFDPNDMEINSQEIKQ